jgi:hypothetical protein
MRTGAISAGLFGFTREAGTTGHDTVVGQKKPVASTTGSAADRFAAEQIRSLVRQVFVSGASPVRQVIFTSLQPEIGVQQVCHKVGQTLAVETGKDVVIVTRAIRSDLHQNTPPFDVARRAARHLQGNLWSLELPGSGGDLIAESLHASMVKIRSAFEYSLIATSSGASEDALLMGQVSDGIVLVVSAMRTRRAVALRFRSALAQSRLLGTVLIDREFPVPAAIYKHL